MRVPDPAIEVDVTRCYECGRWWGIERGEEGTCPRCAQAKIDRAWEETKTAQRSAAAARGAAARKIKAR